MVQEGEDQGFSSLSLVLEEEAGCAQQDSVRANFLVCYSLQRGEDGSEYHISSYGKNKQLMKPTPSLSLQYLRYTCRVTEDPLNCQGPILY